MGSTIFDVRYAQVAFGSIKDVPAELKQSHVYTAACVCRSLKGYFLESTGGFKQLLKGASSLDKGLKMGGIIVSPPVASLLSACTTAKNVVVGTESFTKLKNVFKPLPLYSVWAENFLIGIDELSLAKASDISNWMMSNCDNYRWAAKLGFVVARKTLIDKIFNVASVIHLAHGIKTEGIKWRTGKVVNPMNGREIDFDRNQRIKSLFSCIVIAAYATMTIISALQLSGIVVANAAFWNFVMPGVAMVGAMASHFWEELMIKQPT